MRRDLRVFHCCGHPKCPAECLAAYSQLQALKRGVQVRSTTRRRPSQVGHHRHRRARITDDDPDEFGGGHLLPAPDARANR